MIRGLAVLALLAALAVAGPPAPAGARPIAFEGTGFAIQDDRRSAASLLIDDQSCQALTDLNVVVNWEHPDNGQLRFRLVHPSGAELLLSDQAGSGTSGGSVLFTDEAAAAAGTPATGVLRPVQPLAKLNGQPLGGTWTLTVDDEEAGGSGMVESWALFATCPLTSADEAPFIAPGVAAVPEGGTGQLVATVTGCQAVTDVDVEVAFEHPAFSQLQLVLSHAGIDLALWQPPARGATTGAFVTFDDEATTPASAITPTGALEPWDPGTGAAFRPDHPLTAFDGAPGNGAWALIATDAAPNGAGELQHLGLRVTCGEPHPSPGTVTVLAGASRVQTAIAVAQSGYPTAGSAAVGVLATEGNFADALAGTPLAVYRNGPILLTAPAGLHPDTAAELQRVLPPGATVYLLGGEAALSSQVEADVAALGYTAQRLAGATRFETAAAIADEVGGDVIDSVLIADGTQFQPGLVAGALAPQPRYGGLLLLSAGSQPHPATDAFLAAAAPPDGVVTVGDTAALAYPAARHVADVADPAQLSALAAQDHDTDGVSPEVGIANSVNFPDGLTGGAHIARLGGVLLLTEQQALSAPVDAYLRPRAATIDTAFVYGGDAAIAPAVREAIAAAIT